MGSQPLRLRRQPGRNLLSISRHFPNLCRLSHAPIEAFVNVFLVSLSYRTSNADCLLYRFEGNPQVQGLVVVIGEAAFTLAGDGGRNPD